MRCLTFLVFIFSCTIGTAQTVYHQSQYWLKYQVQLTFNKHWQFNNEIDNRRFFSPDLQHQLIIHSRGHYRINRWDFGAGLTLSWAYTSVQESVVKNPLLEIRPVSEVSYEIPIKKSFLQQRLRYDNRFFEVDQPKVSQDRYDYVGRIRYRIQWRFPIKADESDRQLIGLRLADEIMFNTEGNVFDQQRFYITSDLRLNKRFSFEAGYINIYQQRRNVDEFFLRHVVRLSLIHRIGLISY